MNTRNTQLHKRISNKVKGFTIIETLIAITVLMIAIAGPLAITYKALTTALYAKDQMTALYLAQESMEVLKNTKDNNVTASGGAWLTSPTDFSTPCMAGSACDASALDSTPFVSCATTGCPLTSTGNGYSHNLSGIPTPFTRYYYLTTVAAGTEVRATVVVKWKEGNVPQEIDLSSEMTDVVR